MGFNLISFCFALIGSTLALYMGHHLDCTALKAAGSAGIIALFLLSSAK